MAYPGCIFSCHWQMAQIQTCLDLKGTTGTKQNSNQVRALAAWTAAADSVYEQMWEAYRGVGHTVVAARADPGGGVALGFDFGLAANCTAAQSRVKKPGGSRQHALRIGRQTATTSTVSAGWVRRERQRARTEEVHGGWRARWWW